MRAAVALLVCMLMLCASPIGQGAFLWLHLATAHAAAAGDRPARSAMAEALEREAHALASDALHEHDGVLHSHDEGPTRDDAAPSPDLSRYFVTSAAAAAPARPPVVARASTPWTLLSSPAPVLPVDLPPPRS